MIMLMRETWLDKLQWQKNPQCQTTMKHGESNTCNLTMSTVRYVNHRDWQPWCRLTADAESILLSDWEITSRCTAISMPTRALPGVNRVC